MVVAAVIGLLVLTGCSRTDIDLEVSADDTVSGTILIAGALADESDPSRQAVVAQVLAIEGRVLPGLRDREGVTASAVTPEAGWLGTELVLTDVPLEQLTLGTTPLITRVDEEFVVSGNLDPADHADLPAPDAAGVRAGAEGSSVVIALTFPGAVDEVGGSEALAVVDGSTVTWETSWDQPLQLEATASASAAVVPPWIWQALIWGVGILAVLAVAGLVTVYVRSRND